MDQPNQRAILNMLPPFPVHAYPLRWLLIVACTLLWACGSGDEDELDGGGPIAEEQEEEDNGAPGDEDELDRRGPIAEEQDNGVPGDEDELDGEGPIVEEEDNGAPGDEDDAPGTEEQGQGGDKHSGTTGDNDNKPTGTASPGTSTADDSTTNHNDDSASYADTAEENNLSKASIQAIKQAIARLKFPKANQSTTSPPSDKQARRAANNFAACWKEASKVPSLTDDDKSPIDKLVEVLKNPSAGIPIATKELLAAVDSTHKVLYTVHVGYTNAENRIKRIQHEQQFRKPAGSGTAIKRSRWTEKALLGKAKLEDVGQCTHYLSCVTAVLRTSARGGASPEGSPH